MAEKCHMCLLGLIILCPFLTGSLAQHVLVEPEVVSYPGQTVTLKCQFPNPGENQLTQVSWLFEKTNAERINIIVFHPNFGVMSSTRSPVLGRVSFVTNPPTLDNPSIQIRDVKMTDEGRYICEYATYPSGSKQGVTSLVMLAQGQTMQAKNVTVLEGGTAQISCHLHNYDGSIVVIKNPHRQTVFFNGTRALKDARFQMALFTPKLVRITLTNVSVSDEGGYFCQDFASDENQQVAMLSVVVPPEVPMVEVKTEIVVGREAELTCLSPRSKPPATLRWVRDWREIAGVISEQENGKTVSVSNTIRIPVERKDNGAVLSCEASHPALVGGKLIRHYSLDFHYPTDTTSETEVCKTAGPLFRVIVIIAEIAAFAAPTVILLQIVFARRAGTKNTHHPREIEMTTILE